MKKHLAIACLSFAFCAHVSAEENALPTPVALPQKIYGLEGNPCIIRFDALVYAPIKGSVLCDVQSRAGAQYNETFLWHPKEKGSGESLKIALYSGRDFRRLGEAESELVFCDPRAVTDKSTIHWLAIGDSLTVGGHYISQTLEVLNKVLPGVKIATVGTQQPKDNDAIHHEGRGGWSWVRYLEADRSKSQWQSPFVFGPNGAESFDFARFIREQLGGKAPEVVTIFLGANDVYGISADFSVEKVAEIIGRAKTMVAKIREAAPESMIGIIPPPPPSDQDGFGVNYQNGVTEWQYRRAMQHYVAGLLKAFDGREKEKIYIVPGYLAFNPATAYPMAGGRAQNALHPTAEGYKPISQSLGAWFVHLLSTN